MSALTSAEAHAVSLISRVFPGTIFEPQVYPNIDGKRLCVHCPYLTSTVDRSGAPTHHTCLLKSVGWDG